PTALTPTSDFSTLALVRCQPWESAALGTNFTHFSHCCFSRPGFYQDLFAGRSLTI
ncbi:hypothetical protein AMECASPLE_027088, partial [Ameca splendens]